MNITYNNLNKVNNELRKEFMEAYERVLSNGSFIADRELYQFETEFADYCGSKYCIGVGSGLDAIELILRAFGIGSGDEVLVPSNTFIATLYNAGASGANSLWVPKIPSRTNSSTSRLITIKPM